MRQFKRHKRLTNVLMLGGLLVLLSANFLFAASQKERESYRLAGTYERKGEYAKAESLYVELYRLYPSNYNYYNRYKSILIQQRKFKEILPLLERRYQDNKNDQYLRIELSVLLYTLDDKKKAQSHWEALFSKNTVKFHSSYANAIYSKVLEYRQGSSFYEIVNELRKISRKPDLLVRYNFSIALRYRNWDQAIDEINHIIDRNPSNLKYVRNDLFKQDPNSILFFKSIDVLSKSKQVEAKVLLSDIYVYIGDYDLALKSLSKLNEDPQIQSALSNLANTLLRKQEYTLSYDAADRAFRYSRSVIQSSYMIFIKAEALMGQFRKNNQHEMLVPRPFASSFSELPLKAFEDRDVELIEEAYAIYDSLSYGKLDINEKALLALIDIDMSIYQDIDKAMQRALNAINTISIKNREKLLERMVKLYLAKGDLESAQAFISNATEAYSLMVHEEDKLLVWQLYAEVVSGKTDSLSKKVNAILSLLSPTDERYNDILNYSALIMVMAKDSVNREQWQEAELELAKQDPAAAAELYKHLITLNSGAKFVYVLRYLDFLRAFKDMDLERGFWGNMLSEMSELEMADYFYLAYADFLERDKKSEKAIEIYEKFLLSYQDSMYFERVREYMRQLNSVGMP